MKFLVAERILILPRKTFTTIPKESAIKHGIELITGLMKYCNYIHSFLRFERRDKIITGCGIKTRVGSSKKARKDRQPFPFQHSPFSLSTRYTSFTSSPITNLRCEAAQVPLSHLLALGLQHYDAAAEAEHNHPGTVRSRCMTSS